MKVAAAIGWLVLTAHSALAENSYVCIPDKSAGFAFDSATHKWNYARFNVTGKKYLMTHGMTGWEWYESGNATPFSVSCKENKFGFIDCDGEEDIRLNTGNLRYQTMNAIGYISDVIPGHPEGSYAPRIEIGTCSVK
jgi:hypothetical protein